MLRLIWFFQTKHFRRKQDFLKSSPKFHLLHSTKAFWHLSIPMEMSVETEDAHPMEISIRGFDVSQLLHYIFDQPVFPIKW